MYATAINLERLVWLGPSPQEPQSISDDFLGLFGARVCAEADIFAHVDTAESMQKYHRSLANLRGIFSGSHSTLDLLPPDAQRRLQGYMDLVEDSRGLGGSCVADLSQNPAKRPRIGPWFGACTRSSMFISLTAGASDSSASAAAGPYLFSPAEISFANGWPSIPVHGPNSAPSVFTDTYPEVLKGLGARQLAALCGNGMHLHTISAWLMYVKSHCVTRKSLLMWNPMDEERLASSVDERSTTASRPEAVATVAAAVAEAAATMEVPEASSSS